MKPQPLTLEQPSADDLRVLLERAEELARTDDADDAAPGALYVTFGAAGLPLSLPEAHLVRMVPRIGTLHAIPGTGVHLSWIDMRPHVVVDLADAFGRPRGSDAVTTAPGFILRSAPGVVVAVSGPLDLIEDVVAQEAGRGAWPHDEAGVLGKLTSGAFVLSEEWLERWVASRAEGAV